MRNLKTASKLSALVAILVLASVIAASAQNFSITGVQRLMARNGQTVFQVSWADQAARYHQGYYHAINTAPSFFIDKRSAGRLPFSNQPAIQSFPISVMPRTAYYIHLAPLDARGRIGQTESFLIHQP